MYKQIIPKGNENAHIIVVFPYRKQTWPFFKSVSSLPSLPPKKPYLETFQEYNGQRVEERQKFEEKIEVSVYVFWKSAGFAC